MEIPLLRNDSKGAPVPARLRPPVRETKDPGFLNRAGTGRNSAALELRFWDRRTITRSWIVSIEQKGLTWAELGGSSRAC